MRKGILDVSMYEHQEKELMLGCLSALTASGIWLMVATFLKLPISGTHSIVGATVGFSLVARGTDGLHWSTLGTIGKSSIINSCETFHNCSYVNFLHTFTLHVKKKIQPYDCHFFYIFDY